MKSIGIRKFRKKNSSKNNFKVSKNFSKIHNPITCSDPSKPIAFMIQPTTMTKKMTIEATLARLTVVFINDLILLTVEKYPKHSIKDYKIKYRVY